MSKKVVHLVFGDFFKSTFEKCNHPKIVQGHIIRLNDDLRIGPIFQLNSSTGQSQREKWLQRTNGSYFKDYYTGFVVEDSLKIEQLKADDSVTDIYVWSARNALDGLYTTRLLNALEGTSFNIYMADFCDFKLKSAIGNLFDLTSLALVRTSDVPLLLKRFKIINEQAFKKANALWKHAIANKAVLRGINDDGKIQFLEASHFDNILLQHCTENYQKSVRVVVCTLVDIDYVINDGFLDWRLKVLVQLGRLHFEGQLKEKRDYSIKKAS
ncbi:DUF1835 domain-containing protein [Flavobacteriaceae bacterium GSB9]|nr:DUF1835 domain-containing protein [Flavobacteriaceae bacterium GSB9]